MAGALPLGSANEAVVVPLRVGPNGRVERVTHVRSTVIAAALLALKKRGHFDPYLHTLPAEFHEPVLRSVAGTWLELRVAVAHYRAVDALGLPLDEQLLMGRGVSSRVNEGLLGTAVRIAKQAGVTPWLGLAYVPKGWARLFRGGAPAVYKLGPKEARYEAHGLSGLATIPYYRNAARGMILASGEIFCERIYVQDVTVLTAEPVLRFRLMWA